MQLKTFTLVLICVCAVSSSYAQQPPVGKTPVLSEVQKLHVQLRLKEIENAQLRLHIAQQEFQRAQLEIKDVLESLKKEGFRLDLQKLEYVVEVKPETK